MAELICFQCDGKRSLGNISINLHHNQNFCTDFEDIGKPMNCTTSCFKDINYEWGNKNRCKVCIQIKV